MFTYNVYSIYTMSIQSPSLRHPLGPNEEPIYDLTRWSKSGVALEGTGSLVLDRHSRTAYVATSQRADRNLAEIWAKERDVRRA